MVVDDHEEDKNHRRNTTGEVLLVNFDLQASMVGWIWVAVNLSIDGD